MLTTEKYKEKSVQVFVRDNNVDQALRVLKKKMQREGMFREMRERRAYEKPSERRVREKAAGHRPPSQGSTQAAAARRIDRNPEAEGPRSIVQNLAATPCGIP
jgi:small subunit ribosomal protein S21